MEFWLITTLSALFAFGNGLEDPIHRMSWGRQQGRNLNCEWLSHEEALRRHPYEIGAPNPRFVAIQEQNTLVCSPRTLLRDGLRHPRDERILSELTSHMELAVSQAVVKEPETDTWYVEVHHPQLRVAQKIGIAAQTRLAQTHTDVRAQSPLPAAGDVQVLSRWPLVDALPLYCLRKWQEGSLAPRQTVLTFALLHPQETELHAGTCREGRWQWLH